MGKKGKISLEGYRKNSPDKNNDFNIIPSQYIDMHNVDHDVLMIPMGGRGTGNPILAKPGERYFFPNHDFVFEQAMPENAMMRYQRIAKTGGMPQAKTGYELAQERMFKSFQPSSSSLFTPIAPVQFPAYQNLPYYPTPNPPSWQDILANWQQQERRQLDPGFDVYRNLPYNVDPGFYVYPKRTGPGPILMPNHPGGFYVPKGTPYPLGPNRGSAYRDPYSGWDGTGAPPLYTESNRPDRTHSGGIRNPNGPGVINPVTNRPYTWDEFEAEGGWEKHDPEAWQQMQNVLNQLQSGNWRNNPNIIVNKYGGGLPKAQMYNSQVNVTPIQDQFIYPQVINKYSNDVIQNRAKACHKGECLEGANTYYNKYVAPKFGLPDTWKLNEAYGIVSGDPNQPYGISADSWDLAALMQAKGAIQNYAAPLYEGTDVTGKKIRKDQAAAEKYWKGLSDEEKKSIYSQMALGTLVNFGDYGGFAERLKGANEKAGLYPSRHSARVVGFTETGVPVIYDYGHITRMDDPTFDFPVTNITTPKEVAKYNFKYLQDWQAKNQKKLKYDPKEKLLLAKGSQRPGEDPFTEEELKYVEGINKNIANLMQVTGASQEDIIKAGKVAFGILQAETRGGRGAPKAKGKEFVKAALDPLGLVSSEPSRGLTRIKPEMQAGDETNQYSQYLKALGLNPKDLNLWDPEQASLATTALILSRKGDIEGVDKWYLRAQQHNTPSVGPKNTELLKEAQKDYADNVIKNTSRLYSTNTGYGLSETEKWMSKKKGEKAKKAGEQIWSERFKTESLPSESTGYAPKVQQIVHKAYGGPLPMAQAGRIQATPTYASGKEQNTLESMSIDRRNYEQALANQLAQQQLADAKLAMNVAGLVFYPAAVAASAVDFYEGNYGQGLAGLVPFVGPASKANTARNILNQASRNLLTKSYNAGIPYKIAAPIIKGAKKSTMYGANAVNVEDAYSAFNEHAYGGDPSLPAITGHYRKGGRLPNKRETNKNIKSSINYLMRRNETLFGPPGKNFYNPNPMSKYYKGGIAFPQQPTAGDTKGQQESEFYSPNWIPPGPVGFYEHGGIAYPQLPTENYFFSGSPWMPHYEMGGLPGGANNMPCYECGGYMENGGPTPVPAMDADAWLAKNPRGFSDSAPKTKFNWPTFKTRSEYDKFVKNDPNLSLYSQEDLEALGLTAPVGVDPEAIKRQKANQEKLSGYIAGKKYGGYYEEGGFMTPENMTEYPTFYAGGYPMMYADGGASMGYDQDDITDMMRNTFLDTTAGNVQNVMAQQVAGNAMQNIMPYMTPQARYGAAYIPKAKRGVADIPEESLLNPQTLRKAMFSTPAKGQSSFEMSPELEAKRKAFYDASAAYDQTDKYMRQQLGPAYYNQGAYNQGMFAPGYQTMQGADMFGNTNYRVGRVGKGMENFIPYLMANPQLSALKRFDAKKQLFGPGARRITMDFETAYNPQTGQVVQLPKKEQTDERYLRDLKERETELEGNDMNFFERMKAKRAAKKAGKEDPNMDLYKRDLKQAEKEDRDYMRWEKQMKAISNQLAFRPPVTDPDPDALPPQQRYGGMYEEGGFYDLTEDEIQQIMAAGGSVTYLD